MLVVCGGSTGDGCCDRAKGALENSPPVPVRCAGCGGGISDRYYLLAVDRQWHITCLTCCQCKVQLDSELTCFARDGHIYCKEDYYRMFSVKRCTRCHLSISPSELVMRAREHVYHLHCFTCATCNKPLTKGEYFGLKDDVIYCRQHYEMLLQYERPYMQQCMKGEDDVPGEEPEEKPHEDTDSRCPSSEFGANLQLNCGLDLLQGFQQQQRVNGNCDSAARTLASIVKTPGQKGRPRKQKSFLASSLLLPHRGPSIASSDEHCSLSGDPHQSANPLHHHSSSSLAALGSDSSTSSEHLARPKRMRTSFKHHQLRAMKSYFAINHNPDAKDLKQLSQKTGLSKRVLQVWFQNARAKWRRNLLRQQSQGPEIAQDCKPLSELAASQPQFCDPFRLGSSLVDVQPTPITQEEQNIQTFTNLL